MFQRAKVQKFESQSQHENIDSKIDYECFKEQKYKNLKANHNSSSAVIFGATNVSKSKSTKI